MTDSEEKDDQEKFNETLKRMLKTPPDPKTRASVDKKTGSDKSTRDQKG
ncbi:hypothetical protein [Hoeflea sp.]|nr:hypothetical protein [Hoeflea sp.]MBC7281680.1 hypothetical protein [Hoeflea sp.]